MRGRHLRGTRLLFERERRSANGGVAKLTKLFERALKPGAVIKIRIIAPGFKPKAVRYTVRRGKIPAVRVA